jgi:hypothetical protein
VTVEELPQFRAPPPEGRWFPVSHSRVVETVKSTLQEAGFDIRNRDSAPGGRADEPDAEKPG